MTEEFLHFLWRYRNYDLRHLHTTDGEPVDVLRPGEYNTDSGPDFFNARIRIGETLWAGNVEVHLRSSDWMKHSHQHDNAYSNIILHVVHEADQLLLDRSGKRVPTLELTGRIHPELYRKYLSFRDSSEWISCGKQAGEVNAGVVELWMERLLIERLERKSARILDSLALNQNDWEASFYTLLARNFGFRTNGIPFEMLAKSTPYLLLARYRENLFQLEALLLGQAGMLDDYFSSSYVQRLQSEYRFIAHKHQLAGMEFSLWKFMRMRPYNFPTVRIAQFAMLMHRSTHLFSTLMEKPELNKMKSLFQTGVSDFWKTHYTLQKESKEDAKEMGEESIENILINTVAPFLFTYGKQKGDESLCTFAIELFDQLKAEKNSIVKNWNDMGLAAANGGRSQALFELRENYCLPKRCLDCAIGRFLLKREMENGSKT